MRVREELLAGKVKLGVFLSIPSADLAEMLGHAGFDFVLADVEHGTMSVSDVADIVRGAAAADVPSIVRLSAASGLASVMLDAAAEGVQLTGTTSADAADRIAELRYPPDGIRGFSGYTRAARFGLLSRDEILANVPLLGVQVEVPEALERLDTICMAPGLDLVFFGPVDFSVSSSRLPEEDRTPVETARRIVADTATRYGRVAGCHARTLAEVPTLVDEGFRYITVAFTSITATYWRDVIRQMHVALELIHG